MGADSTTSVQRFARGAPGARAAGAFARVAAACARAADLWLPRACALCDQALAAGEPGLCLPCSAQLPGSRRARCGVCGIADSASPCCASCAGERPAFDRTVVLADYAAPLDRLILALKFRGELPLARPLGALLAQRVGALLAAQSLPRPDLIVPVPLSAARVARRGFNQSQAIAAALGRGLGIGPDAALLRRVRDAPAQSSLSLEQRRRNLDAALLAGPGAAGLRIALVDDVMTSGATLQACAAALKAAGAALVINLVVARTP